MNRHLSFQANVCEALFQMTPESNWLVSTFVHAVIALGLLYAMLRFMVRDGWASTTSASPGQENETADALGTPLCHRCLTPHPEGFHYCPKCGASVGMYNNLDPYDMILSTGELLRIGTTEKVPMSSFRLCGFLLASLAQYHVFAPVYWFVLFRNARRNRDHSMSPRLKRGIF